MQTQTIKLSNIEPHELQPRDRREIADLRQSIANVGGLLVPPIVMQQIDGRYKVLSGHRRIQAAKANGFKEIECEVRPKMALMEQVRLLTAANIQQEVTPLQKGEVLATLTRDRHIGFTKVCHWMGLSTTEGRCLMRLRDAPDEVQRAIKKGDLAFGTFKRELVALSDDDMLAALNQGGTRRAIKRAKRQMAKDQAPPRLLDDSRLVLEQLMVARKAVGLAQNWLIGAESAAAADVMESLRVLAQMLHEADTTEGSQV